MEIKDQQLAANWSWHRQLVLCAAVALMIILVPVVQHRVHGLLYPASGFDTIWGIMSLILIAYMAQWTWYEWRQLQKIRRLDHVLTVPEFRRERARERLHSSLRAALGCVAVFGWLAWMLRGFPRWPASLFFMPLIVLAAQAGRAWREVRRVSA